MKKIKILTPIISGLAIAATITPILASCSQSNKVKVKVEGNATVNIEETEVNKTCNFTIIAKDGFMLLNDIVIKHGNDTLPSTSYYFAQNDDKTSIAVTINSNIVTKDLTVITNTIHKIKIYNIFEGGEPDQLLCNGFTDDFLQLDPTAAASLLGDSMEIPHSVTEISQSAFFDYTRQVSLIPSSVKAITFGNFNLESAMRIINEDAFKMAPFLFMQLPESVRFIGRHAFYDCNNLTLCEFNSHIEHIGIGAFGHCENLLDVRILASIKNVGENAFRKCHNLCFIEIDKAINDQNISIFGKNAFDQIADSGTLFAKTNYSIKKLNEKYPDFIDFEWSYCDNPYDPFNVYDISDLAINGFKQSFLDKLPLEQQNILGSESVLTIPNGRVVSANAFFNQENDTTTIPSWVQYLDFDCKYNNQIYIETFTEIGENAFKNATSLKGIYIPSSIETIGSNAFCGCSQLEAIDITSWISGGPLTVDADSFKGIAESGKIYYSSKTVKTGTETIQQFIDSWKTYFQNYSITFDDSHWVFVNVDDNF